MPTGDRQSSHHRDRQGSTRHPHHSSSRDRDYRDKDHHRRSSRHDDQKDHERRRHHRKSHHSRSRSPSRRRRDERKDWHDDERHPYEKRSKIVDEDEDKDKDSMGLGASREQYIETGQMFAENAAAAIPTSESLAITSKANPPHDSSSSDTLPVPAAASDQIRRDEWMLPSDHHARGDGNSAGPDDQQSDYFASLGTSGREKRSKPPRPNPDELQVSSREINEQFKKGIHIDDYDDSESKLIQKKTLGGPGHQWRMMKLRRVYEAAEEEGREVTEVALERYGSMDAFNEARTERQYLEDLNGAEKTKPFSRSASNSHASSRRNSPHSSLASSRTISRQSSTFRKPGDTGPSTPQPSNPSALRNSATSRNDLGGSKHSTPIPSVFTPTISDQRYDHGPSKSNPSTIQQELPVPLDGIDASKPPLDKASLNKLSAKVMRAEMTGQPDASELRKRLEMEKARADAGGDKGFTASHQHETESTGSDTKAQIQVLPTLDAQGRLYDVGKGADDDPKNSPFEKKRKNKFETRDPKTGELLRYNADDDEQTLADLVREEKFSAGSASQKNMDAQLANRITADKSFKDSVDYMDENVERLGRRKMKSDAMKRQFAIQDFARTKKALDTCTFCWQDDRPPRANIISSGTRSFLALPDTEQFVPGHCLIVPMQHHLSTLEADEDTWEEMKNFMKCLIQMAASQQKSYVFFETVKSLKYQHHTYLEAMPVDQGLFTELPSYFRQAILDIGDEWSQNRRLITFSSERPFRSSMVPQLPYFMIQFDYRGHKGFGHIIEDQDKDDDQDGRDNWGIDDRSKGSGDFPKWFAAEVIGSILDFEPRQWRKPHRIHTQQRKTALERFKKDWDRFDWTIMLQQQESS